MLVRLLTGHSEIIVVVIRCFLYEFRQDNVRKGIFIKSLPMKPIYVNNVLYLLGNALVLRIMFKKNWSEIRNVLKLSGSKLYVFVIMYSNLYKYNFSHT